MGRVVRSALLALVVVLLLGAVPGPFETKGLAAASGAGVSDPSPQLAAGLPVARDGSNGFAVEGDTVRDRVDVRSRLLPVAVLPVSCLADPVMVAEPVDVRFGVCAGCVGMRGSSRAPPCDLSMTSL